MFGFSFDFSNVISLITGASLWEVFKYFIPEIRRHIQKRREATRIFYESIDSIIKVSDELLGKLISLAKEDFATFINIEHSNSNSPLDNQVYACYLVCQQWTLLQYIRRQSNLTSITRLKKGRELLAFLETFESRKFRLLDRSKQRIIGEAMMLTGNSQFKVLSLYLFVQKVKQDEAFAKYIEALRNMFFSARKAKIRQRILVYGVIVALFLGHFDQSHNISRPRLLFTNKLRPESLKLLYNVLLRHYLPFIRKKNHYCEALKGKRKGTHGPRGAAGVPKRNPRPVG